MGGEIIVIVCFQPLLVRLHRLKEIGVRHTIRSMIQCLMIGRTVEVRLIILVVIIGIIRVGETTTFIEPLIIVMSVSEAAVMVLIVL